MTDEPSTKKNPWKTAYTICCFISGIPLSAVASFVLTKHIEGVSDFEGQSGYAQLLQMPLCYIALMLLARSAYHRWGHHKVFVVATTGICGAIGATFLTVFVAMLIG
ncbi:hypothetical protein [Dyella terrae]|uniref:hypothetical protein n=1 Tax=Dyella terrae TaxID=522259 RepID=UPI001EFED4BA|nr:hypothetical protein [Dyella terrae]ULU26477.1 hypothetical protein DYST_03423 [Dyella terrae]